MFVRNKTLHRIPYEDDFFSSDSMARFLAIAAYDPEALAADFAQRAAIASKIHAWR
jgi:hypothetical protein